MTPFLVASDLHLDAHPYLGLRANLKRLSTFEGYLLLPGDVVEFPSRRLYEDFLALVFTSIPGIKAVIAVLGNHEYYGATFEETEEFYENLRVKFPKYVLLNNDNDVWVDTDYLFVGGTLWYPDTVDTHLRTSEICDFSEIRDISLDAIFAKNRKLKHTIQQIGKLHSLKTIWLTHHLPSLKSVSLRFKGDPLNCYFVDPTFEELIHRLSPDLVVHGHSHHTNHYQLGDTYVVSNPRGVGNVSHFLLDRFLVVL
jgi:predicted phosphodiesterase